MAAPNDSLTVPGLFSNPAPSSSRRTKHSASNAEELSRERTAADTLRFVLANSKPLSKLSQHDRRLIESFQAASTSDKSFVGSVADCSKTLQDWCEELEGWAWSGNFEVGGTQAHSFATETDDQQQLDHHNIPTSATTLDPRCHGGLSASQLSVFADRLLTIKTELENIDMAEMKDRALTTHLNANGVPSMPQSAELQSQPLNGRLDVLSALVTVALLEALPYYSKVQSLHHVWSARISILKLVPRFSVNVSETKTTLDLAWKSISDQNSPLSDLEFERVRNTLENKVATLGRTIDFMLDTLEGLEDTLPGEWIDNVESLEVEYSAWVVAARKIILRQTNDREPEQLVSQTTAPLQTQDQATQVPFQTLVPNASHGSHISDITAEDTAKLGDRAIVSENSPESSIPEKSPALPTALDEYKPDSVESTDQKAPEEPQSIQPGFDFQFGELSEVNKRDISAHARGASIESVDSEIANPDGSYRFPVNRRQSIYRTASLASFGTIAKSQIKSVDLGGNAGQSSLLRQTALARARSVQDLKNSRDLGVSPGVSGSATNDKQIPTSSSLDAMIRDLSEQLAITSSASESRDVSEAEPLLRFRTEPPEDLPGGPSVSKADFKPDMLYEESAVAAVPEPELPLTESLPELERSGSPSNFGLPLQEQDEISVTQEDSLTPDRPLRTSNLPISTDEQLERRIDRILTTIPARINFSRRVRPEQSKLQTRTPDKNNGSGLRSVTPSSDRSPTPSLTLAPAEPKEPRAARSSGDSAIKLYHLYQAGRQQPIKLYVRLVGENGERVMVRVGGGWADLGEYLREYASHHSRTVVPEPNVPLQAVDLHQPGNSRVFSLPGIKTEENSTSLTPPDSPTDERRWSAQKKQRIANTPADTLYVPSNRSSLRTNSVKKVSSLQELSSEAQNQLAVGQDDPSEFDDEASGPRNLSAEKKQWLDQMVSKAKKWKANGGSSRSSQSGASAFGFGDLGSVGATRRVYRVSDASFNSTGS